MTDHRRNRSERYKTALLVVILLAAAIGWYRAYTCHMAMLGTRHDSLTDAERADLQRQFWTVQQRVKTLASQVARRRIATASADSGSTRLSNQFLSRLTSPQVTTSINEYARIHTELRYASLFASLAKLCTPQQIDRLKQLLIDRQSMALDILASAGDHGGLDLSEFNRLMTNSASAIDADIKSALGDDGYATYSNFAVQEQVGNVLNRFNRALGHDSALTSDQAKQMGELLTSERSAVGDDVVSPGTISPTVSTQAAKILSPPQLAVLRSLQQQQTAYHALQEAVFSRPKAASK
jgi:hypothetical protein